MKWEMDEVIKAVHGRLLSKNHCLIVVSEGAGQNLLTDSDPLGKDKSGNKKYLDIGVFLKKEIEKRLPAEHGLTPTIKLIDPCMRTIY